MPGSIRGIMWLQGPRNEAALIIEGRRACETIPVTVNPACRFGMMEGFVTALSGACIAHAIYNGSLTSPEPRIPLPQAE
jgi:hypothetical protein